ncbi:hypothetical protein BGX34_012139 [Mortierella sp. NVP85]|nr:hypothetical protein BGX34_012139 [Mortierella sp. NVP85]
MITRIPLVFPVFGKSKAPHVTANLPQHGFARISHWELDNSSDHGETVTAQFGNIAKEHRDFWPFDFALIYTVKLTALTIETHLKVHNTGDRPFDFNTLLHTYFLIPDVEKVRVVGLDGYDYVDKVLQQTSKQEGKVVIAGEVDSVYAGVKTSDIQIQFGDGEKGIQVHKNGLNDIVVWNPWVVKSKGMADFGDDEYNRMICVEAGQVAEFLTLAAGGSWEGSQILSLL